MSKKLRFTGEWPPPNLWGKFPNWEYALDEEGEPGQDETTLRPAKEQKVISGYLALTTGEATLGDGRKVPALVELLGGTPGAVVLFLENGLLRIHEEVENEKWAPYLENWLPATKRHYLEVLPNDSRVFPLRFVTTLPRKPGGESWDYAIGLDGSVKRV